MPTLKKIPVLFSYIMLLPALLNAQAMLPPEIKWSGKSETLIAKKNNPWITSTELSGFTTTPSYDDTKSWCKKLADSSPVIHFGTIGFSAEHREIFMLIASSSDTRELTQELRNSEKPLILVQAGIHSGEIDGKDAGMMLMRDIAFGDKKFLLDHVNIIFIPILNVDGHERSSPFGRVNQRGPSNMGWRTNARNLNLNRDYTKLDCEEVRGVVNLINTYDPDIYIDIHVTDGADYQYDITYGFAKYTGYSPAISRWLQQNLTPAVDSGLTKMGHIPGPLIFSMNNSNFLEGNSAHQFGIHLSNAYGDARHTPSVLVENHSLKPYRQRVLGTYVFLENLMLLASRERASLSKSINEDRKLRREKIPVEWVSEKDEKGIATAVDSFLMKEISHEKRISPITGRTYVQWTGKPVSNYVKNYTGQVVSKEISRPRAYIIPSAYHEVIENLKIHGIAVQILESDTAVMVERYKMKNARFSKAPNEGRFTVSADYESSNDFQKYSANSYIAYTHQPLGDLLCLLLEPASPQSLFHWGFFSGIFSRTEYIEDYVMEPYAQEMLKKNSALKEEFEAKIVAEPDFAKNPDAIMQWFYAKTPYFDPYYLWYPVGRLN